MHFTALTEIVKMMYYYCWGFSIDFDEFDQKYESAERNMAVIIRWILRNFAIVKVNHKLCLTEWTVFIFLRAASTRAKTFWQWSNSLTAEKLSTDSSCCFIFRLSSDGRLRSESSCKNCKLKLTEVVIIMQTLILAK